MGETQSVEASPDPDPAPGAGQAVAQEASTAADDTPCSCYAAASGACQPGSSSALAYRDLMDDQPTESDDSTV